MDVGFLLFPTRPYSVSDYMVNLGAYKLSVPSGVMSPITAINIHPIYKGAGSSGDIALLKLQYSIQYTDYIMPICIPEANVQFPSGMYCFVTGWGSIRQGGEGSLVYILTQLLGKGIHIYLQNLHL